MIFLKKNIGLALAVVVITFGGCSSISTSTKQYVAVDKLIAQEKYREAASVFGKSKEQHYDPKDRVLFWIDHGMLNHFAYQDSLAIVELQKADFAIEELYTTSISKGAASMLLNDNALDYSGEDYENLYINVFKALSYYREGDDEAALVEIRRLTEKFVSLEKKYNEEVSSLNDSEEIKAKVEPISSSFYSSALAHYLSMILYFNDRAYDDARISKEKLYSAFRTQKDIYNFSKPNVDNLVKPSDNSKIAFLSFLGRAPKKYEYVFSIDTYKNLVIISIQENGKWVQFSSLDWHDIDGGLHAKFAVPKMQKRGSIVSDIEVIINGKHFTTLFKLESLENVAFETFKRDEALIYMKSLARTIAKAIANEAANKELDKQTGGGSWGDLTRMLTGALINATENADLRIAHYLPAMAYVGDVELQPGTYNIEVIYKDEYSNTIAVDKFDNYNVPKGKKINLIETVFLH